MRLGKPPADLATCTNEPEPPALSAQDWSSIEAAKAVQFTRDTLTFGYALALRSAYGDCAAKVDGLRTWRESTRR